jgi:hypothetical protein
MFNNQYCPDSNRDNAQIKTLKLKTVQLEY